MNSLDSILGMIATEAAEMDPEIRADVKHDPDSDLIFGYEAIIGEDGKVYFVD